MSEDVELMSIIEHISDNGRSPHHARHSKESAEVFYSKIDQDLSKKKPDMTLPEEGMLRDKIQLNATTTYENHSN